MQNNGVHHSSYSKEEVQLFFFLICALPHLPSKGATPQLGTQPRFLTFCLVYTPGCLAGWITEQELQKGSNVTREKVPKIPDPISHQCYRKVCSINMVDQVIGCTLIHIDPWPSISSSQRRRRAKDGNATPKNMAHDVSLSASHLQILCSLDIYWRNVDCCYSPLFSENKGCPGVSLGGNWTFVFIFHARTRD